MKLLLLSALALLLTIACSPVLAQAGNPLAQGETPFPTDVRAKVGVVNGNTYLLIEWYDPRPVHWSASIEVYDSKFRGHTGTSRQSAWVHIYSLQNATCTVDKGLVILTENCLTRYNLARRNPPAKFPPGFLRPDETYQVRVEFKYTWKHEDGHRVSRVRTSSIAYSTQDQSAKAAPTPAPTGPIPPVILPYSTRAPTPTPRPTATPWPTPTPRPPRPTNEIGLPPGYHPYVAPTKAPAPAPWPTATPWTAPTPTPAANNRRYRVHGVDSTTADGLGQGIEAWLGGQQGYNLHSVVPVARDRVLVIVVRR